MTRKKYKGKTGRSRQSASQVSVTDSVRWRSWWWLVVAITVVGAGVVLAKFVVPSAGETRSSRKAVEHEASAPVEQSFADTAWDPAWPPLPQSGPPARPIEMVRAAYAYAVRRGDVLQYMPCYCGCERQGHGSNRDCFLKGKTAAGAPQWDAMGFT